MKTRNTYGVYFSPTNSTRKIVESITYGISDEVTFFNITQRKEELEINSDDIVVIGVPSYSGRVPKLAKERLLRIKSNGANAILVCSYGNRDYEDTLKELYKICIDLEFNILSMAAFIARHSIFPNIASHRPDKEDLANAAVFGKESLKYLDVNSEKKFKIKGSFPYCKIQSVPLSPKTSSNCNKCGLCVKNCPVNAIDSSNPKRTDKKFCIVCGACIVFCPTKAREFKGFLYKIAKNQFTKKYSRTLDIELFYPAN